MPKVIEIAISENAGKVTKNVDSVKSIAGKGLINDRHFKENNEKKSQITLIEIENINYYNKVSGTSILPKDFRRNIITEGIKLNDLVEREFFIGKVKVKAHDLCRPCKYLEKSLNQKNFVKELLRKGGLRCEILTNGEIFVGDEIKNYA
jgi:MOSC domain-containing protein YiiM